MQVKRRLSLDDDDDDYDYHAYYTKRIRVSDSIAATPPSRDVISNLPTELLIRILSYLTETTLLEVSPVSHLFHRVASDGQLWRAHYYRRFILPRAHMIPGFRRGFAAGKNAPATFSVKRDGSLGGRAGREGESHAGASVDWMKCYRLQHNWSRGKCDIDVLRSRKRDPVISGKTLVKVVEGLAITADITSGLLVWDLTTRASIAHADLNSDLSLATRPTCLAVDEEFLSSGRLGISVGFKDGTFAVWTLDCMRRTLNRVCRHERGCLGGVIAIAYAHPFLLAASRAGSITLWTLDPPPPAQNASSNCDETTSMHVLNHSLAKSSRTSSPYLLRSLKSQTTRAPLTLAIRRTKSSLVASIVYTLDTVSGWAIGIQDLDIHPAGRARPEIVNSRVATTIPRFTSGPSSTNSPSSSSNYGTPPRRKFVEDGPIRLCYSHPYLLATLPDNTLMLHLCNSTPTSLSINPGIRLWGHTSGISDAEITARGKAVSVSARGDEIRIWELEGRMGGSSIEVRPRLCEDNTGKGPEGDFRRQKVGFDDEMVIVLKEALDGRESLMVYDFT